VQTPPAALAGHRELVPSLGCITKWKSTEWEVSIPALYQMPHPVLFPGRSTGEEKELSLRIMKYWANFARTG
jgi:hypothetical protein